MTLREARYDYVLTHMNRGFFGRGDMQKEFEEAAFRLNKGEVSGIVETASGVHLIQRFGLSPRSTGGKAN